MGQKASKQNLLLHFTEKQSNKKEYPDDIFSSKTIKSLKKMPPNVKPNDKGKKQ